MTSSFGRILVFIFVVAFLLPASSRPAHAEPAAAPETYTSQILIADGASIGLIAGGAAIGVASGDTSNRAAATLEFAGVLGYFLAAPIVHFRHKRVGVGVLDLAARI